MSKRSADEDISKLKSKLRKLKEKERNRRRIVVFSDSSSDSEKSEVHEDQSPPGDIVDIPEPEQEISHCPEPVPAAEDKDTITQPDQPELQLDPELLLALGESTLDAPIFGEKIIDNLAQLWAPLLVKGMSKENKEEIVKEREYLIPENCKLLQAPKLNAEISAAIPDMVKNRDRNLVNVQQQLGSGMTAINRAMDILLKGEDKALGLKHLSNACRILSDLHSLLTQNRIKLITPSLDKTFLHVIQDAERDETLFGNKLPDKIKAAKTIEKQGLQIKKAPAPSSKPTMATQPTGTRSSQQGNWHAPPRYPYPSNRGGRGGNKRPQQPPGRRPYSASSTKSSSQSQSKPRAATT